MIITKMHAREILDSRGNPTVEVEITSKNGCARASAPSGASTGKHEAVELRDGGKRYLGKGVLSAVENVNKKIAKVIIGKNLKNQKEADAVLCKLDGSENKSSLGANATVAASMAIARCFACEDGKRYFVYLGGKKLPQPMFNILNGGKHAGTSLSIQEFMIIPKGKKFSEKLQMASEIYHILGKQLAAKYGAAARNVGDEGGFAPPIKTGEEALQEIEKAIAEAGYKKNVKLALDAAASSFYHNGKNTYTLDGKTIRAEELLDYYISLAKSYPVESIEDPFQEEDFDSFAELTKKLHPHSSQIQIVGDDLLVTNLKRIKIAIAKKSCNALLLKVNQIGTVSEAIDAAKICKKSRWNIVVSHRSGETEDNFIADLAVGINAEYIKAGAPARGERTAKYNQLLRIEERIKNSKNG